MNPLREIRMLGQDRPLEALADEACNRCGGLLLRDEHTGVVPLVRCSTCAREIPLDAFAGQCAKTMVEALPSGEFRYRAFVPHVGFIEGIKATRADAQDHVTGALWELGDMAQ